MMDQDHAFARQSKTFKRKRSCSPSLMDEGHSSARRSETFKRRRSSPSSTLGITVDRLEEEERIYYCEIVVSPSSTRGTTTVARLEEEENVPEHCDIEI